MSKSSAAPAVPQHIGFILDGNRRWAHDKGLPSLFGHQQGYETLKTISLLAYDKGIKYVSAFVFSTENWNRSKAEVNYLMRIVLAMVTRDLLELHNKGIKLVWFGSEERVSTKIIKALRNAEHVTKDNTKGTLVICFNYGGQQELADATKKIVASGIAAKDITPDTIGDNLYCPEVPAIDMLVRTSGEQRISNFMLWRAAYSELMFIDKHWPAFNEQDLDAVITEFGSRKRRFGS